MRQPQPSLGLAAEGDNPLHWEQFRCGLALELHSIELHSIIASYVGSKCYWTNYWEQNLLKAIKYKNTEKTLS